MYYMYIRVVFRGAFPCLSSQSDGLNKYNSEILRQSPFVPPSCITYTLGGFTKGFFLVFHLKSVGGKTQIKLSPFPHVFCSSSTRVCRHVLYKTDVPPLSGHAGISPTTQIRTILYKNIRRSWGETIGTRIDRDNTYIQERGIVNSNCNVPFPHVFSLSPFPLCVP